ncbi:hypothetical protein SynPROSU1_02128 [Synechococcus sp. PROS-U-1]|nr:hypothetical protein SynPROSU1_02128 [Synechococcus sp. PROS-U-1]
MQAVDTLNTVLLSGGRGGGKSILLIWLIIYFAVINGKGHRGVLIRTDLAGLQKLESLLYDHIPKVLPGSRYFKAKRQWQMSNGAILNLIHQSDASSFNKLQGEDLSHVYVDELTQFPDPQTVLRIRSSMRTSDPSIKTKFIATANPFPHGWWCRDYIISKSVPGRIFNCELFGGVETVWFKSTLRDNPYLANPDQYEADLKASAFGDESRARAEIFGDWAGSAAGFFGTALSEEKSLISGDFVIPQLKDVDGVFREESRGRHCWIGGDWGTASPACAVLMYQVQEPMEFDGKYLARGSWVCVDEEYVCSTQQDGAAEWNRGDRTLTAPKFVERVTGLYRRHGFVLRSIHEKRVIMDSAVTAQLGFGGYSDPVTLSTEFKKYGWLVTGSPKSSRAVGWQLMKSLLFQAGTEQPGLYISERCQSLWATLPYCISDPKNPEDMEKDAPDHSADAVRYVLTASNQGRHLSHGRIPKQRIGVGSF